MRFHKIIGHMNGRCRSPIMSFNIQGRSCHAERSEASLCPSRETLRFAQGDNTVPMLGVKVHYRGTAIHRARGGVIPA